MTSLLFKAVGKAFCKPTVAAEMPKQFTSDYYGKYIVNKVQMTLSPSKGMLQIIYDATIDNGAPLNRDIAVLYSRRNKVPAGTRHHASCRYFSLNEIIYLL